VQISATYSFDAPPATVWNLLIDPTSVAACLPGCEKLEPLGPDTYRAELSMGIAAITGRYEGTVSITDQQPPHSYRMLVDGSGTPGFVKGQGRIELREQGAATLVTVSGDVQVGGLIARVGQRLLSAAAKMTMDRFFGCLQQRI